MENRLNEIIISITNRCNLRCAMCHIPYKGNDEMSTDDLKKLIFDARHFNPRSIVFSGGEPLLRKDIFELISFTNQYKINTCLTSNGTIIDNDVADRLASSGIGVVNISIEGPQDTHDSLRGRGSFQKSVAALGYLSRHKIETTIATVICRQNYKTFPFTMELAHQFGVTTVKFQPFNEIFLIKKDQKNNFMVPGWALGGLRRSIEKAIELSKKYRITINPTGYLENIPAYLCGLRPRHINNGCSALESSCPISAEGNVFLCWVLSDNILGNIKTDNLSRIWNSDAHRWKRKVIEKKGCLGCMMSCYDYNFGQYNLSHTLSFKIRKFRKKSFYKRQYYRIYQYIAYLLKKVVNRITNLGVSSEKEKEDALLNKLKEIKLAKRILKNNSI